MTQQEPEFEERQTRVVVAVVVEPVERQEPFVEETQTTVAFVASQTGLLQARMQVVVVVVEA